MSETMSMFSYEEKKRIMQYVSVNKFNEDIIVDETFWQEVGQKMNRDWSEIRDAYHQWTTENVKFEDDCNFEHFEVFNVANENTYEVLDVVHEENKEGASNDDELQYVHINGKLININHLQPSDIKEYEILNNINCNGQDVIVSRKRLFDSNDFNVELLKSLENQSKQELEMKREEHEKKMKILQMQQQQGEELHKEKLKILKTKLRGLQEQLYHIDHAICNKNLKKKFKSGPI